MNSITPMAVAVALISGHRLQAPDWPQWRGVSRDGKVNFFVSPEFPLVVTSTNLRLLAGERTALGPATDNQPGRLQFTGVNATNHFVHSLVPRWPEDQVRQE